MPERDTREGRPGGRRHGLFAEVMDILVPVGVPAVLMAVAGGWWLMRRSLAPIEALTRAVEKTHERNLRAQIPRSGNGDELDRLTEVFNAMTTRLDQSFQRIREFTLHASHELKTPLTVMQGEIETACRDEALDRLAARLVARATGRGPAPGEDRRRALPADEGGRRPGVARPRARAARRDRPRGGRGRAASRAGPGNPGHAAGVRAADGARRSPSSSPVAPEPRRQRGEVQRAQRAGDGVAAAGRCRRRAGDRQHRPRPGARARGRGSSSGSSAETPVTAPASRAVDWVSASCSGSRRRTAAASRSSPGSAR